MSKTKETSSLTNFSLRSRSPKLYTNLALREKLQKIENYNNRSWLEKRKKTPQIQQEKKANLRKVFDELDSDKTGMISIEEFYESLLSIGLVETKEEVTELFKSINASKYGVVSFNEFLKAFEDIPPEKKDIQLFSKQISLPKATEKEIPFALKINQRRRNLIMQAYLGQTKSEIEKGKTFIESCTSSEVKHCSESPSKQERIDWYKNNAFKKVHNRIKSYRQKQSPSKLSYGNSPTGKSPQNYSRISNSLDLRSKKCTPRITRKFFDIHNSFL